ncbi:disulfide bond formation protein DsbA [Lujinxingia litoralis]|uniref:Disulfide bond formation protein DsbA n=1 Tax=Lujinxingia litoralis TaxID=2211119 RepID=A0A328C9G1_9DELT|nr:DsbA family oxidoreductase [Lujinxingia litoralis]RAL25105.1 disulfide bond formation protein DsbA [Lujinxingia litoralis]
MKIEIWSDVVCPWCYIGKRRFESALQEFRAAHPEEAIEIVWRSFELDPQAPELREEPLVEHLAAKYGMSLAQARQAEAQVVAAAHGEGLEFDFAGAQSGNTFNAHRLIHASRARGLDDAMKERLMRAYFTEGRAVGRAAVLVELAEEVGLTPDEAQTALNDEATARAVRQDQARARELGIRGVPFFVLNGQLGVSGAQPPATFLGALNQARASAPLTMVTPSAAPEAGCDDTGCKVGDE